MPSKLHEVKETTTDVINIIRELREPEVQKSLENIKAISNTVKDIVAVFKAPEFAKNVESISLAADNLKESMVALQNTAAELNKAGTLAEVNMSIKSVRNIIDSISDTQTEGGVIVSISHLLVSVKQVLEETRKVMNAIPKKPSTTPPLAESK